MRWNFGGNLKPVRMICEYDWKECPIAVASYIWSEIVTDVVDTITGEANLWRILAVMLLCSMLFHTIYYKMRWVDKSEHDFARDHLIKVGFKMQDLELKINILTYKMQYGTWPLPHEIYTPSLNDLQNVKLTLSNTSRQNMWTKHHLHGYIPKCNQNSDKDKSMNKLLSMNEEMDLDHQNFLSQYRYGNKEFYNLKSERDLKLLHRENNCKDYEKLIKTANECRRYMDEINESNKSLGLFDNSSDISDQDSVKDISGGTESEQNSHRFLLDPKKWHEIYKYKNKGEEVSEIDLTTSNQMLSMSNFEHKDSMFPAGDERYPLKSSKNRSRLLPPGLSITFLSGKFKTFASSDKCITSEGGTRQNKNKTSTNETLNKVKEKLESLHDIKHAMKNSKSLSYVEGNLDNRKGSDISSSIETNSKMNLINRDCNYEKKEQNNMKKFDNLISSQFESSAGDNSAANLNQIPFEVCSQKLPLKHSNSYNEREGSQIQQSNLLEFNVSPGVVMNTNLNNVKIGFQNPWNVSNEIKKDLIVFPPKPTTKRCGVVESLPKITSREENLSTESDSSVSFGINSTLVGKKDLNLCRSFNSNKKLVRSRENILNDKRNIENNINLNVTNEIIENIPKTSMNYVFTAQDKSARQIAMETDEDTNFKSQTSSQTELSKDSDTDDKSTTTLLREALGFKKALLMQIDREKEMCDEKDGKTESSEYDSDDLSIKSKTDNNHFRSKLLDIISEEQSAGSSTERTSRTYVLSRSNNETNLCEIPSKSLNENINAECFEANKVTTESKFCGDSKSVVTASSSEYFSTNNITDNEHASAQKINLCIADGDGFRELQESCVEQTLEDVPKFNVAMNHENNDIAQFEFFEKKLDTIASKKSQDIFKKQTKIQPEKESSENTIENSKTMNKLGKLSRIADDIDKIESSIQELCENQIPDEIVKKSEAKINVSRNMSSIDLEKGISWNSISESTSNESIVQFVNALANLESKNIDTIAEQKLMMLNSTDYEGRNFATAGEDSRYSFNSRNKKQPRIVSLPETNISEQSNGVMKETLEMIADSAIFKLEKLESREKNTSTNNVSRGDHSEGSNLFNSHSVLKLDQEKLQRKQDIYSKLKTLDAFTKPLDIGECNSEKNEIEENPSPLTGRTVVCISNSNLKEITESLNKMESDVLKNRSTNRREDDRENLFVDRCEIVKSDTILDNSNKGNELSQRLDSWGNELNRTVKSEKNANTTVASQNNLTVARISSTHHTNPVIDLVEEETKLDTRNNCQSSADRSSSDSKNVTNLESKKIMLNSKRIQLSKSSITNFSTDTSESYFDVSNHDFAVSSIILTSQNSNFASNHKDEHSKSDTSSSYVDASEYCSKIPSNLNSTVSNTASKKNCFSESEMIKISTDDTAEIKTEDTGIPRKDIDAQQNFHTKHESLTKTELIPKCTSSLPSNDKKNQLHAQEQIVAKDKLCVQSSSNLDQGTLKYWSNLNIERSNSKGRAKSRSCIPILKSRIETPKREKSLEATARSRSPVHRSHTPRIQSTENNEREKTDGNDKMIRQSSYGSRKSLNRKQSYTLPSKNNDTRQERLNAKPEYVENKESKIMRPVSSELAAAKDKPNLLTTSGQLTKECTVIYINIISDSDRNETQTVDAKELIKYINENDLIPQDKNLDPKFQSLSLRNIKSDRSDENENGNNVASPASDSNLCKNLSEVKSKNEKVSNINQACLEAEKKDSERMSLPSKSIITTANKLLSTSTLQLLKSPEVEQREKEVSAKPSVKNTSTSVSDFPNVSPERKRSFYNPKNEMFDITKDLIQKEQIVLSEMLTSDPNFFECKKTHKLYNKLGLCFQEQIEKL